VCEIGYKPKYESSYRKGSFHHEHNALSRQPDREKLQRRAYLRDLCVLIEPRRKSELRKCRKYARSELADSAPD